VKLIRHWIGFECVGALTHAVLDLLHGLVETHLLRTGKEAGWAAVNVLAPRHRFSLNVPFPLHHRVLLHGVCRCVTWDRRYVREFDSMERNLRLSGRYHTY